MNFFRRAFQGYIGILKLGRLLTVLLFAAAVLGFIVAWPLWYFATTNSAAYSIFTLAVLGAGIVFAAARRIIGRRARSRLPSGASGSRNPLLTVLLIVLWLVIFVAGIYAVLFLYFRGIFYLAFPAIPVLILLLGYIAFILMSKNRSA
jgi:hypothetical protein